MADFKPRQFDISERRSNYKSVLIKALIAVLVLVFIYLSYTVIKPLDNLGGTKDGEVAKIFSCVLLCVLIIAYVILRINKKTNFEVDICFLLAAAFTIRLMYMLYTPYNVRQYDTFARNNNGHFDYALYVYKNFALPTHAFTEQNIYQFYHPPLYYFVSAVWMKIYNAICFNSSLIDSEMALFGSMQIMSCFFTFLISVYSVKTLRLLNLSKKAFFIAVIFCIFFPRLIQFSGQINNDVLATLFMVLSTYRLIKWAKQGHGWLNFMLTALYLGLAMMTKLSAVIMSLGMAVYFLIELIRSIRKKQGSVKLKTLVLQYACFLLICAPLGLWFQFYAHYVYGIPFNFVFRNLNTNLFVGTRDYVLKRSDIYKVESYDAKNSGIIYTNKFYNVLVRFISPVYFPDYEVNLFCNSFYNYNILTFALKSAIFGEFSYPYGRGFAFLAIVFAYLTWFAVVVSTIINMIRHRKINGEFYLAVYLFLSIVIFYLYLQVSMPYGCSMDFRYITAIILPLGIMLGKNIDCERERNTRNSRFLSHVLTVCALGFIVSSNLFYFTVA